MPKGKRIIIAVIILLLSFIIIGIGMYYIITNYIDFQLPNKSSNVSQDEQLIVNPKSIIGLEEVKIIDVQVENSSKQSRIKVSLENTSDEKITGKEAYLYLLDNEGNSIFGSFLILPDIDSKSEIEFNLVSTTNIENMSGYRIELYNEN